MTRVLACCFCLTVSGCGLILDLGAPEPPSGADAGIDAKVRDTQGSDPAVPDALKLDVVADATGVDDVVSDLALQDVMLDAMVVDATAPDVPSPDASGDATGEDAGPCPTGLPRCGGECCLPRQDCHPRANRCYFACEGAGCDCSGPTDCFGTRAPYCDDGLCVDTDTDPEHCGVPPMNCGRFACIDGDCFG